jgi:hypothetical protein
MSAFAPQAEAPRRGAGPLALGREAPAFLGGTYASRPARLADLEAALHSGGSSASRPAGWAHPARPEEAQDDPEGADRDAASLEASAARHRGRLAQAPAGREWAWGGGLARAAEASLAPAREDGARRFR